LAKEQPEKFKTFYKAFGPIIKIGLNTDFTNREKLIELLRFESTKTEEGEFVTLREYVERMGADQKEIYYHSGNNRAQLLAHPNIEYFREHGIEVLLLSDPVDMFVIPSIHEFDKKPLKSIEKADCDFSQQSSNKAEPVAPNLLNPVLQAFKEALSNEVEDVVESRRLVSSPVTLVSGKDAIDSQLERMMKMMNTPMPPAKRILEVNSSHPIVRNIAGMIMADANNPLIKTVARQLYEGALFLEGSLEDATSYVTRMNELIEAATLTR
jgi:molecular chaperone HtpG